MVSASKKTAAIIVVVIFVISSTVALIPPSMWPGGEQTTTQTTKTDTSTTTTTPTITTTETQTKTDTGTTSTSPTVTIITSGQTTTPEIQPKILGKQIPPDYVMGNPIDIDLATGMSFVSMKNPGNKVSLRFTAQLSGEAKGLAINGMGSDSEVHVSLQEDRSGTPSGEYLGMGTCVIPSGKAFVKVSLETPVTVIKDKIYHIVVEPAEEVMDERISILTYVSNSLNKPFNTEDPDIPAPDPKINTLLFDGGRWQQEGKWPIFVIEYSDGSFEGQPYSLAAPWVIHGRVHVGQALIPASEYNVGRIAFVVSLKGEPTDSLYYEVRDPTNTVLAKGLFAEASQLTTKKNWIEIALSTPVRLEAGKQYRIALYSPGTDLENAYRIYGHEFSYEYSIGYGGLQHQLTSSYDAGTRWSQTEDADCIFKLTTT